MLLHTHTRTHMLVRGREPLGQGVPREQPSRDALRTCNLDCIWEKMDTDGEYDPKLDEYESDFYKEK